MADAKPPLAWISTLVRGLFWVIVGTVITVLFLWKPVVLLGLGIVMGAILLLALVVGAMFWNDTRSDASAASPMDKSQE